MRRESFRVSVQIPSAEDFLARFPQYAAVRSGEKWLLELIMTAENFTKAKAVTDLLGFPAVTAVADLVSIGAKSRGGLTGYRKQLAGALVCSLMIAN